MKYQTKQKELILSYFKDHKSTCITALQLKEEFENQKIGLTTIYRCLQQLEKENVIRKYNIEHSTSAVYEYVNHSHNSDTHYHLKCTECDSIIHLECNNFIELTSHIANEHHFMINPCKTTIYGICEECANK